MAKIEFPGFANQVLSKAVMLFSFHQLVARVFINTTRGERATRCSSTKRSSYNQPAGQTLKLSHWRGSPHRIVAKLPLINIYALLTHFVTLVKSQRFAKWPTLGILHSAQRIVDCVPYIPSLRSFRERNFRGRCAWGEATPWAKSNASRFQGEVVVALLLPGKTECSLCRNAIMDGDDIVATSQISVTYNFNGFFQPGDNLPIVNVVAAGQAIPLKFSLNGDRGLNIFVAGYPSSAQIACGTSATSDIEETVLPSSNSLSYDAGTDRYIYVWKTDKAWKGSCRLLFVRFNDGGPAHTASFKFK